MGTRADKTLVLLFFIILCAHALTTGITDDEAYYWVLAQKPALGFAYHPPLILWVIGLSQKIFSDTLDFSPLYIVRFPAVLIATLTFASALYWIRRAGGKWNGALIFLSFVGWSALSWMMVPDSTLFLGYMWMFVSTWELCFRKEKQRYYFLLGVGVLLSILSKYSAVLGVFSAALCFFVWAPKPVLKKGLFIILACFFIALIPIVIWNATHHWESLLYQIEERHQNPHVDLWRYFRFWLAELFLTGPVLIPSIYFLFRKDKRSWFILAWVLPGAAVFCVQPLFSDFKIHWAFIVWLPLVLALSLDPLKGWIKAQVGYGFILAGVIFISCHVPVVSFLSQKFIGKPLDPLMDITNDLYGWSELYEHLRLLGLENWPVIGSRYQTTSQAAFALRRVSEMKESAPFLFVADNRYNAPPEFKNSKCRLQSTLETNRWGYLAKQIFIWKCEPSHF